MKGISGSLSLTAYPILSCQEDREKEANLNFSPEEGGPAEQSGCAAQGARGASPRRYWSNQSQQGNRSAIMVAQVCSAPARTSSRQGTPASWSRATKDFACWMGT